MKKNSLTSRKIYLDSRKLREEEDDLVIFFCKNKLQCFAEEICC